MSAVYHERPGVYADYDVSSVASNFAAKTVAVVAQAELPPACLHFYRYDGGIAGKMGQLLGLLFLNGASHVIVYPVAEESVEAYTAAVQAIFAENDAQFLVLGSEAAAIPTAIAPILHQLAEQHKPCVGLAGVSGVENALAAAAAINSERMVLFAQNVLLAYGNSYLSGGFVAAAVAGQLSAQADPAVPLHGLPLVGVIGVDWNADDDTLDRMVIGGVASIEAVGGQTTLLRCVTTKTKDKELADITMRELSTVLIVDEVVPSIRNMLRSRFLQCKNTAATRSAIVHQMVLMLEQYIRMEIIDSYSELSVTEDLFDPTVCSVEFGFTVTHGLGRIYLTAHISV